jgi:hypothetical protein
MPDRTRDPAKRRASDLRRLHRFRGRKRAAKQEAERLAKIAHRAELDAKRTAKGLPPIKTSTQRAQESRARVAAAKLAVAESKWYSALPLSKEEARQILKEGYPSETDVRINQAVQFLEDSARRWSLRFNKFLVRHGVTAARTARAILWQCWRRLDFDLAMDKLPQAMRDAESQTEIEVDPEVHPSKQFEERRQTMDFSQAMLGDGGCVRRVDLQP